MAKYLIKIDDDARIRVTGTAMDKLDGEQIGRHLQTRRYGRDRVAI